MNIQEKLDEIIPQNNRTDRDGFSNHDLIDNLNIGEREQIEQELIKKLKICPCDTLIIDTLSYLKSKESISELRNSFNLCANPIQKVAITAAIYNIAKDEDMINLTISSVESIADKRDLWIVFSYLKEFDSARINNLIKQYINDPDFLISYNAKRALGLVDS